MKIGFFDSGIGGLTVLRKVVNYFGNHKYFYFGDTLNVPYGSKPQNFLINNLKHIFDFFEMLNVDLLIAACNTTDSLISKGLAPIKNRSFKYVSIIENGIYQINSYERVLLLATYNTIKTGRYRELIISKNAYLTEKPCPLFVPLIEEGYWYGPIAESIIKYYLKDYENKFDKVLLGCTHYPLIQNHIYKSLKTTIIDPANGIIKSLSDINEINYNIGNPKIDFYISGNLGSFIHLSRKFLRRTNYIPFYHNLNLYTKKIY